MTPIPSGRLFGTADGPDLVLTREFRAPIEDVWASLTEPDRTARWYGPWKGEAGPGRSIQVQLAYEEGTPWSELRIDVCEPPRRLAVSTRDEYGHWRLELLLSTQGDRTELRFVHHLTDTAGIGEVGPGWEYYLDRLVAAHEETPMPSFDAYYPATKAYFEQLPLA
ncbi:SRPBCC family protein [Micromonospora sp. LOL_024]|uniref:SRPBCC family protein n=1 Tax=Micromonospora sp. LOL_024 TaxID=3345412 RepID=UPI003A850A5A